MRHCGDNKPPVAINRSQLTRFHDPIQEVLSQKFHGKVGINGFTVMSSRRLKKTPKVNSRTYLELGRITFEYGDGEDKA